MKKCSSSVLRLIMIVLYLVQEAFSLVISDGQELGTRRKAHAPNIAQWGLCGRPIGENCSGWNMQKFQAMFFSLTRHGQDLAVGIELDYIRRRAQVHDRLERCLGTDPGQQ